MPGSATGPALTHIALASAVALAASLALAAPAHAAAYMKLGDIKGQTQTSGKKDFYKGWIELNSVTCATDAAPASRGQIRIVKEWDAAASTKLSEAAARGRTFPSAQIHLLNAGGSSPTLRYELKNVQITSYQLGGSGLDDGSIPTETLSLNFDKITWKAVGGLKGEGCKN